MLDNWQIATIIVGGLATLAIFSFLIKENPFYRFFEHLFIGIAAGLGAVLTFKNFIWPKLLVPMLGLDIAVYPDGTYSKPYNPWILLYIAPMLFGLLYYFIYSKKYNWIAKIVIGFSLGISGGLAFKGFYNEIMPQITSSFRPLLVFRPEGGGFDWRSSLENTFFVFTLSSVMIYFFFSFRAESKGMQRIRTSGRWLMMICFGAFFGSTVMARMALLVERVEFLVNDWLPALKRLIGL